MIRQAIERKYNWQNIDVINFLEVKKQCKNILFVKLPN